MSFYVRSSPNHFVLPLRFFDVGCSTQGFAKHVKSWSLKATWTPGWNGWMVGKNIFQKKINSRDDLHKTYSKDGNNKNMWQEFVFFAGWCRNRCFLLFVFFLFFFSEAEKWRHVLRKPYQVEFFLIPSQNGRYGSLESRNSKNYYPGYKLRISSQSPAFPAMVGLIYRLFIGKNSHYLQGVFLHLSSWWRGGFLKHQ